MANSPITDKKIVLLDITKLREHGISVQEFVSMVGLGIYPQLDIYTIRDKDEVFTELAKYST